VNVVEPRHALVPRTRPIPFDQRHRDPQQAVRHDPMKRPVGLEPRRMALVAIGGLTATVTSVVPAVTINLAS
jgi:hypothetical protein